MPKKPNQNEKPRRVKTPDYKHFKIAKRIKHPKQLPSAYKIFKQTLKTIKSRWRLFLLLTVIYGLLTVILVRGFGGSLDLGQLKTAFNDAFGGSYGGLLTGVSLFSSLLSTAGTVSNPGGSVYQSILVIIMSLAVIWSLRQIQAEHKVSIKDAFYKSMYPLIPFVLVVLVILIQLIPAAVGTWLYATAVNSAIAITGLEKFLWLLLSGSFVLLSIYMICSSVFAMYIVTLPDMTPLKALRSARQLVLHRRLSIVAKLVFFTVSLLVISMVIMVPILIYATFIAEWVFFLLTMFMLVIVHAYLYTLYRELL